MNWTDVFTDVPWANGDYGTEIKLDQMVANSRYARERASYVTLIGGAAGSNSGNTLYALVDEVALANSGSISSGTWADQKIVDQSISGLADGLHSFRFGGSTFDRDNTGTIEVRFIKPPEMDFLSMFFRRRYDGGLSTVLFSTLTVILHREAQGW